MFGWLKRFADFRLVDENASLGNKVREYRSAYVLMKLERDRLMEVVERDRLRVEAETKSFAASIAASEGKVSS